MVYCKVVGCKSASSSVNTENNRSLTWHKFPRDPNIRRQWLAVKSEKLRRKRDVHRICGRHFVDPDDFVTHSPSQFKELGLSGNTRFSLKETAVPSQLLGKPADEEKPRRRIMAVVKKPNLQVPFDKLLF